MPPIPKKPRQQDLIERASCLQSLITQLEKERQQIFDSGQVAPENSWIVRYQVKGKYGVYWYYKLQSELPVFDKREQGKSRYKHLGRAGSPVYNDAVTSMVRRAKIDALTRIINTIKQGWIDLYEETEKTSDNS
jgi:hypothetical protein